MKNFMMKKKLFSREPSKGKPLLPRIKTTNIKKGNKTIQKLREERNKEQYEENEYINDFTELKLYR